MEFYRIQIGNVYLTKDGSASGRPCLLTLTGADQLRQTRRGNVFKSLDGTPYLQIAANAKGKTLEIRVEVLMASVWESVVALINNALETRTTLNVKGTGDLGVFDVNVLPLVPRPFEARDFIDGRILSSVFRFITV